jgi:hypothetical protein
MVRARAWVGAAAVAAGGLARGGPQAGEGELATDGAALDGLTRLALRAEMVAAAATQEPKYNAFTLDSQDKAFSLKVNGLLEFRWIGSVQDRSASGTEEFTQGFEQTRTRVGLSGHMGDPSLKFFIWSGVTGTGSNLLLDAWVSKTFEGGLTLKVGQFKNPVWQEWYDSETRVQFVERTVLDARFDGLYGQGVEASVTRGQVKLIGQFSDGLRSWNDPDRGQQWGLTGRADWKVKGEWADRADFTSFRGETPHVFLGVSGHVQDGGTEAGIGGGSIYTNDTRIWQVGGDVQVGFGGANVFGAVLGNFEERPGGAEFDQWGVLVQGGVFVSEKVELVARYEWGDLDGQAGAFALANPGATENDTLSIVTAGVNYYVVGHAFKIQVDAGVALDEVSGAWGGGARGWQGDEAGADAQVVLRGQVVLLF